jgi:hypothetical protein
MKTKRNTVDVDTMYLGVEPTWNDQHELSVHEFCSKVGLALGWYNYFYDKKNGKKTLLEYLKKNNFDADTIKYVRKAPDWSVGSTIVALCKMRNNGLERSEEGANTTEFFNKRLNEIVDVGKSQIDDIEEEDNKTKAPVVSIQQRMLETASSLTDPIEEAIESFSENGWKSDFDTFAYLQQEQVKGMIAQKMLGFYSGEADELEEVLLGKDEQLVEGYSHMKKAHLKAYAKFMRGICDDIERYVSNQKATRKPRKTKAKPVTKIVEKVKYAKTSNEYKLQSIDPTKVVGAMQLWVFNVKTRQLGVYNAVSRDGLTFKGTTLQGFDEATSIKKTLRKPEEGLKRCLDGGKIVLRKLMGEITTKESPCNGRINQDTILLRVV